MKMNKKLCFIIPLFAFVVFLNCAETQAEEQAEETTEPNEQTAPAAQAAPSVLDEILAELRDVISRLRSKQTTPSTATEPDAIVAQIDPKTVRIELDFNSSIGDMYELVISPEGVVRDASREYRNGSSSRPNEPPAVGAWGTYTATFEAVSEGEAEIVVYNHYRFSATGKKVITYKAIVDSENNLTLTVLEYHGDGRS